MYLKLAGSGGRHARVTMATNNGDVGGGEVMLIRIAQAMERLGVDVNVVAPSGPDALARAAEAAGLRTERLPAANRADWMRELRRWDRTERRGLLWCNGLVPAVATAGHASRVVHLHQEPGSLPRRLLVAAARRGALETLVPSEWMSRVVPGAHVLPNWTEPIVVPRRSRSRAEPFVVGYLGRLSPGKGVTVLADAMAMLDRQAPGRFRLLVGGAARFVGAAERLAVEQSIDPIARLVDRPGWVERGAFLARIDVLVVPSTLAESFGLVAVEAMAARVPVVVSNAGALPEVVGEQSDLVVPAGDAGRLAGALAALAEGRVATRTELLHERWATRFSPEAGLEGVGAVLSRLGIRHDRPSAAAVAPLQAAPRGEPR